MNKIIVSTVFVLSFILFSCDKEKGTCSDRSLNQNEIEVDCGGVCEPCATCTDGKLNGFEDGIDCGGDCPVCPTCEDGQKNQNEVGIDCGGACEPCSTVGCSTPLGYAQNAFLMPSGTGAVTFQTVYQYPGDSSLVKLELNLFLPYDMNALCVCRSYAVYFYNNAFLKMPVGSTQLFKTDGYNNVEDQSYSGYGRNKCSVIMDLGNNFWAALGQNVYVTRVDQTVYNLRFCNINAGWPEHCNITTKYSVNVNFTVNPI